MRPDSTFLLRVFAVLAVCCTPAAVMAATYPLPPLPDNVIGELQYVRARHEDTLLDIGRRHGVGYEEIVAANPGVDPWLPGEGAQVLIPSRYILPDAPREGVVVSLSEHRLYYFPPTKPGETPVVETYPVSVGKMDWKTPLGRTRIIQKRVKPIWYPPESVRREHAAEGRPLPRAVPPGPDNPLGEYAMRLGIPGGAYLIHGTNRPAGVGMPVTHGCIRMFPEDIQHLFEITPVDTPVLLTDQPYKMGWRGDDLYIEIHAPLEAKDENTYSLTNITRLLVAATQDRSAPIDWARAERAFTQASGVPEVVTLRPATVQNLEEETL
ncbi:MAG: L,D-transpeptidase family protein [Steroidobacteraceae bacterium]|jgi:L,D-transpeptidase ErfK/SrfK|nr:L,D-transpeptidase family protein [Steroidobacteraceae bacterium]